MLTIPIRRLPFGAVHITQLPGALLASAYVSYINQGGTGPLAHLAERVDKSQSTVKGHLWQARKRDLLTGSAGRAGGALTEKASAILARIVPGAQQTNRDTRDGSNHTSGKAR